MSNLSKNSSLSAWRSWAVCERSKVLESIVIAEESGLRFVSGHLAIVLDAWDLLLYRIDRQSELEAISRAKASDPSAGSKAAEIVAVANLFRGRWDPIVRGAQ